MGLAADIGLNVIDVNVVRAGERPCLLVTRDPSNAARKKTLGKVEGFLF